MEQLETFKATLDTDAELDLFDNPNDFIALVAASAQLLAGVSQGDPGGFRDGNALIFGYDKEVGSLYFGRVSGVKVGV